MSCNLMLANFKSPLDFFTKEPQGDLWVDENAPVKEVDVEVSADSTSVEVMMQDEAVEKDFEE